VKEFFDSFTGIERQLTEAAMNILGLGSGWGALSAWEPLGKRLVVEQVYDHQGNIGNGTVPLLVLDMWELAPTISRSRSEPRSRRRPLPDS
jgi:Fe-Mn family superoxide dismutase